MPVKTLAMNRLKGHKRTFYMDEHGGYSHMDVDFYPAEHVEKIIEDLSNQVLEERKKWTSMFDSFRDKRKLLRKERHDAQAALHRLQMAYAYSLYAYTMQWKWNCASTTVPTHPRRWQICGGGLASAIDLPTENC